uniref:Uncharacterized protein n=1 Tax=Anguilla anguilla TaxID=7936 RepID=A0A0E9W568_ANGAN
MSTPYVYGRNRRRHSCLLHFRLNNYRNSNWGKSIQLTSHITWGRYQMRNPTSSSFRFYFPIHSWRPNRHCSSKLINRHCIT